MKGFGKRALIVCSALLLISAGLMVLVVVVLVLRSAYYKIETDHFWRARPVLQAMRLAHDGIWTNDSRAVRAVLLERVPLGADSANAIAALSSEGFGCQKAAGWQVGWQVDCQLIAPTALEETEWIILFRSKQRWIIDLRFDRANRLDDAKVAIWNISL